MIKLYTIGCPRCNILEKKLKLANINFEIVTDEIEMKTKGYVLLPILEVDNKALSFKEAIEFINTIGE